MKRKLLDIFMEWLTLALLMFSIIMFVWTVLDPPTPDRVINPCDCHTDTECMERCGGDGYEG